MSRLSNWPRPPPASLHPTKPRLSSLAPFQDGFSQRRETGEDGLLALRVCVRSHAGKSSPNLPGKYFKYFLPQPPVDFLVEKNRWPFVLMHMRKPREQTRVAVVPPTTAVDENRTPVDAPLPETLAAGSATTPDRPESPEEVTGLIERLSLVGAANNSDGGEGEAGAAACDECGIRSTELKRCQRCWQVAYCGKG